MNSLIKILKSLLFCKIILINLFYSNYVFTGEKTGTTSANFLKISPLPKVVSIGNTYSTLSLGAGSQFYNPAGCSNSNSFDIIFSYNKWIGDLNNNSFAITYKSNIGYFGINILSISTDNMEITTPEKFYGTGEFFNASEFALGFCYSNYFTDKLQLGINLKLIQSFLFEDIYKASSFALDIGTIYNLPDNYKFGITLKNLGNDLKYINESSNLPISISLGFSKESMIDNLHYLQYLFQVIRYADSNEKYSIGLEYGFSNLFYIRTGYQFFLGAENASSIENFSCGIGINLYYNKINFKIDYSYSNIKWLKDVHRISLNIGF